MKKTTLTMAGLTVILVIAGCASMPSAEQLDQQTLAMLNQRGEQRTTRIESGSRSIRQRDSAERCGILA